MKQEGTYAKKRRWPWILLIVVLSLILLLALAAGGAYYYMFHVNEFHLELELAGQEEITLEYGETYEDAGAKVYLKGTKLLQEGRDLTDLLVTDNQVDVSTLGTYSVRYCVHYQNRFLDLTAEAHRTVTIVDTQAPEITLVTNPDAYTIPGEAYVEEGFTAADNYDGDLTDKVEAVEENGTVTYWVADSSGNETTVTRQIVYFDPIAPELTLKGSTSITLNAGQRYSEPGYSAIDNCDGDMTEQVEITGGVDIYRSGTYTLTYTVTDSYGNTATATRTVTVVPKPQIDQVTPDGKIIYLTFDDGPSKHTKRLLEVLDEYNVKATFFVVNTKYIDVLKDIAAAGHAIGIHSATHTYKEIYASEEAYFNDLEKMKQIIYDQTGIDTTLLRFPGGSSNTVSNFNPGIMSRLTQAVQDMGYQYFDWNVTSGDAGDTTSTEQVYQNVINGVGKKNVSIVLQHDSHGFSVDAVERIIAWGIAHGYTFLPLDATSPTCHHGVRN